MMLNGRQLCTLKKHAKIINLYNIVEYLYIYNYIYIQVIKTFSMREGSWYIGIKGGGGVKSKGTRLVIEKEK